MALLPQELVDAIIGELDDVKALKACSLVGSPMRNRSQRILLRSLTLKNGRRGKPSLPNYSAVCALLAESPYISAYITQLKVELPPGPPVKIDAQDIESLQEVLGKLANVQRCIVEGGGRLGDGPTEWERRQVYLPALLGLHVHGVDAIPLGVFLRFMTAAPLLAFRNVSMDVESHKLPAISTVHGPPVHRLVLDMGSGPITELLALPQFSSHTANVRGLSIFPYFDRGSRLVSSVAHTLEHVHFKCTDETWNLSLPPLPALRTAEFTMSFGNRTAPAIVTTVSSLLDPTSSPRLEEIVITYFRFGPRPPPVFDSAFLIGLDNALVAHPSAPCIRWRLDPDWDERATYLAAFSALVRQGMPKVDRLDRLTVEPYEEYVALVDGLRYDIRI
ncbi:hypothetical protein FB451DRAFT_1247243 [Mycena latifolia]|nr:hypothetical protein FB451DRAFT_1247243 [Mycena latifolia]